MVVIMNSQVRISEEGAPLEYQVADETQVGPPMLVQIYCIKIMGFDIGRTLNATCRPIVRNPWGWCG